MVYGMVKEINENQIPLAFTYNIKQWLSSYLLESPKVVTINREIPEMAKNLQ